jgi:NAD(P)-dependent dehydrogenase (short-subunit alcohol dehydrogenase family)
LSAGINTNTFDLDADGIDRHFGVNFLGQFYAINLLYPLIRKTSKIPGTPPPRIVFEASEVHRMAPSTIHFGSLEEINDREFGPTHLYARSKLAMILCAKFLLPEKVFKKNGDHVYALSVHPGTVNTNMQQQWKDAYPGLFGKMLSWAMTTVGRDIEQGSYSALWAATSPEIEDKDLQGYYFVDAVRSGSIVPWREVLGLDANIQIGTTRQGNNASFRSGSSRVALDLEYKLDHRKGRQRCAFAMGSTVVEQQ